MSIKDKLLSTASRAAEMIGLPKIQPRRSDHQVTNQSGKRATPYRRIVGYERLGPLHRQVGIKWLHGEAWPIMQTYFKHRFLHATKGWREYTGGSRVRMPQASSGVPPRLAFYGRR